MSMSVSASSNALSYLQQRWIRQSRESSSQQSNSSPIWSGSSSSLEPGTLAALISLQGRTASGVVGQSPSDLFSQLDTDGDGHWNVRISDTDGDGLADGASSL